MTTLRLAVLSEILADINNTRKSHGIFSALIHLLKTIKGRLFLAREAILFARSLEDAPAEVHLGEGLTIREATVDDLHLFESTDKPLETMLCKRLLDTGATCLMALKDSRLASYVWFTPKVDPAVHLLYLPLARNEVYSFDSYTLPTFRRQGIQSALHQRMFQLLRERGYRRVLILVGLDNHPSLQMHSKLYQAIGRLTRIKVFRLMCFRYNPEISGKARHTIKWLGM